MAAPGPSHEVFWFEHEGQKFCADLEYMEVEGQMSGDLKDMMPEVFEGIRGQAISFVQTVGLDRLQSCQQFVVSDAAVNLDSVEGADPIPAHLQETLKTHFAAQKALASMNTGPTIQSITILPYKQYALNRWCETGGSRAQAIPELLMMNGPQLAHLERVCDVYDRQGHSISELRGCCLDSSLVDLVDLTSRAFVNAPYMLSPLALSPMGAPSATTPQMLFDALDAYRQRAALFVPTDAYAAATVLTEQEARCLFAGCNRFATREALQEALPDIHLANGTSTMQITHHNPPYPDVTLNFHVGVEHIAHRHIVRDYDVGAQLDVGVGYTTFWPVEFTIAEVMDLLPLHLEQVSPVHMPDILVGESATFPRVVNIPGSMFNIACSVVIRKNLGGQLVVVSFYPDSGSGITRVNRAELTRIRGGINRI